MPWLPWALLAAPLALAAFLWLRAGQPLGGMWGQSQTVRADDLQVTLRLDSAAMGERLIEVQVADAAGRPAAVESLRLQFSMAEMEMGVADVEARPAGAGRFRAEGAFFTMGGRWSVVAIIGREARPPLPVAFSFPIAGPADAPLTPVVADSATLAGAQQLYQTNCAACHGASGRGDGPAAASLRPAPSDFAEHMAPDKHSDAQIHAWIRDGVPGSAMPAWGERLSDEEIWQLVAYLRTFAPPVAAAEPTLAPSAAPSAAEPLPPLIFTRAGNLWRSDGGAGEPAQLTNLPDGSYALYPTLAPGGDRATFVITSQGPLGEDEWPQLNPDTRLAVLAIDGSAPQIIWDPEQGVLGQPAWAPDGQSIYVSIADTRSEPGAAVPDRLYQVVRVDLATGERAVALDDAYDLAFSRDGQRVVFLRWNSDLARFRLTVAAPDGADEREVVAGRGFLTFASPRFSPDGQQLIFISPGGPPTDEQGFPITQGRHSPLDALLALFEPPPAEAHGAAADLWSVNVDGTGLRRLTRLRADSPMAVFSPDGARIILLAAEGIYALNADGSDLRQLDPAGDHGGLDWGEP